MSGRRGGPSPNVLRGMGLGVEGLSPATSSEGVKCNLCNARLEVNTDALTQLIERCSTPTCANRRWRHVVATTEFSEKRHGKGGRTPRNTPVGAARKARP